MHVCIMPKHTHLSHLVQKNAYSEQNESCHSKHTKIKTCKHGIIKTNATQTHTTSKHSNIIHKKNPPISLSLSLWLHHTNDPAQALSLSHTANATATNMSCHTVTYMRASHASHLTHEYTRQCALATRTVTYVAEIGIACQSVGMYDVCTSCEPRQ